MSTRLVEITFNFISYSINYIILTGYLTEIYKKYHFIGTVGWGIIVHGGVGNNCPRWDGEQLSMVGWGTIVHGGEQLSTVGWGTSVHGGVGNYCPW